MVPTQKMAATGGHRGIADPVVVRERTAGIALDDRAGDRGGDPGADLHHRTVERHERPAAPGRAALVTTAIAAPLGTIRPGTKTKTWGRQRQHRQQRQARPCVIAISASIEIHCMQP